MRSVTHAIASVECNVSLRSTDAKIHPVSAAGLRLVLNNNRLPITITYKPAARSYTNLVQLRLNVVGHETHV